MEKSIADRFPFLPLFIFALPIVFSLSCANVVTGIPTGTGNGSASSDVFSGTSSYFTIGHSCADTNLIPAAALAAAKSKLHIAYNHTSHGSQLITGMNCLKNYPDYGNLYAWASSGGSGVLDLRDNGIPGACPDLSQGDSVDSNGDTPWVVATRAYLNNAANSAINVVVWSWCSINGHNAQRYVDNMEKLVAEYPSVFFVFMTGHAEGQGENLTANSVHYNNELIRRHCAEKKRILFDFADIESYDPAGRYFWNLVMYDNLDYGSAPIKNWAKEWITANPSTELAKLTMGTTGYAGCSGTAHSDTPSEANLNGILKGRAAWCLWAALGVRVN